MQKAKVSEGFTLIAVPTELVEGESLGAVGA